MNGLNYPPHRSSSGLTFIAGHVYGSLPAHIFLQILFLSSNKLYICLLLVSEKCPVGKHHLSRKRTIYQINQYLVTVDLLNFLLCAYKVSVKSYIVVGQSKGIWTWTLTLIRKKKKKYIKKMLTNNWIATSMGDYHGYCDLVCRLLLQGTNPEDMKLLFSSKNYWCQKGW